MDELVGIPNYIGLVLYFDGIGIHYQKICSKLELNQTYVDWTYVFNELIKKYFEATEKLSGGDHRFRDAPPLVFDTARFRERHTQQKYNRNNVPSLLNTIIEQKASVKFMNVK